MAPTVATYVRQQLSWPETHSKRPGCGVADPAELARVQVVGEDAVEADVRVNDK